MRSSGLHNQATTYETSFESGIAVMPAGCWRLTPPLRRPRLRSAWRLSLLQSLLLLLLSLLQLLRLLLVPLLHLLSSGFIGVLLRELLMFFLLLVLQFLPFFFLLLRELLLLLLKFLIGL